VFSEKFSLVRHAVDLALWSKQHKILQAAPQTFAQTRHNIFIIKYEGELTTTGHVACFSTATRHISFLLDRGGKNEKSEIYHAHMSVDKKFCT